MKHTWFVVALMMALVVAASALSIESLSTSKCKVAGGGCFDSGSYTCSTAFRTGLCPGASNVKCCVGTAKKKTTANKCAVYGGGCFNTGSYTCSVGFRSGLCPGASNVQCCVGTAKKKTTSSSSSSASVTTSTVTRSTKFPSFDKLASCYPQGSSPDVKKRIGGRVNAAWITNTCAVRMSNAFNCAARAESKSSLAVEKQANNLSVTSSKNEHHIYRVKQFEVWVRNKFGKPSMTLSAKNGKGVDSTPLQGKRGLISFSIDFSDATGHLSLWNKKAVVEKHMSAADTKRYFSMASKVYFWQM